jgi:hypothetical protein
MRPTTLQKGHCAVRSRCGARGKEPEKKNLESQGETQKRTKGQGLKTDSREGPDAGVTHQQMNAQKESEQEGTQERRLQIQCKNTPSMGSVQDQQHSAMSVARARYSPFAAAWKRICSSM